jgi:hypothetical protein
MARKTFNYTHGDIGTEPTSALDFAKNERPKAGNFDWYWYNAIEAIKDHAEAFGEIDSDDDGIVDEADTLTAGGNLKGDLNTTDGETLWDESAGYIPQAQLQNTSVTVGGNVVSLGGSTAISHGDLSDAPASAHHAKYTDSEAVSAVNAKNSLDVDISGDADTVDGFQASELAKQNVGVEHDVYATKTDVPTSISKGEVVLIDGDGLYVEQ